jgi:hypothetical protein
LAEKGCKADTPCQPAYEAAFSAASIKIAVRIPAKMNDERNAIVAAKLLLKGGLITDNVQRVLLLTTMTCAGYGPGEKQSSENKDSGDLEYFI